MTYKRIINLDSINSHSKPYFCNELIEFYREENHNYISIKPKLPIGNINVLVLNETSKIILKLCTGKNTIEDIYLKLVELYDAKNNSSLKNTIYSDLIQFIYNFTKLSVIKYSEREYPFMSQYEKQIKNNYTISLADERDLTNLNIFIKNYSETDPFYINPLIDLNKYTELNIRNSLYNYSEEFILLKKSNTICGIVTIIYSKYKSTVCYLGLLMVDLSFLDDIISYIKYDLKDLMINRIDKIKFITISQNEYEKKICCLLENSNFKYEGTLKKEINSTDQKTYSLFL